VPIETAVAFGHGLETGEGSVGQVDGQEVAGAELELRGGQELEPLDLAVRLSKKLYDLELRGFQRMMHQQPAGGLLLTGPVCQGRRQLPGRGLEGGGGLLVERMESCSLDPIESQIRVARGLGHLHPAESAVTTQRRSREGGEQLGEGGERCGVVVQGLSAVRQ
jgi:hypothetical protein